MTPLPNAAATSDALIRVSEAGVPMYYTARGKCRLNTLRADRNVMNQIIYIVGLVVIIMLILGFFGLR
jgi:hypothetical protein